MYTDGLGGKALAVCQIDFLSLGSCLPDVPAVQSCDPRRRGGGRAGRPDQRHPAQGHQPLRGRRGQRHPLPRVSTRGGAGTGAQLGYRATAHHQHKQVGTLFWREKDVRCVSRALLKWCWQWR